MYKFPEEMRKVTIWLPLGICNKMESLKVGEDLFSDGMQELMFLLKLMIILNLISAVLIRPRLRIIHQDGGNGLEGGGNSIFRQMYNSRLRFPILILTGVIISINTSSYFWICFA